ncbi:MAG TPA: cation transporter, partial [Clostridia bacterium]
MRKKYTVTGMTCASCSAHVQKAVSRIPGVERAEMNLVTEKLDVTYDSKSGVTDDILRKAVEHAGYGLVDAPEPTRHADELKTMRIRLILAAAFSLPLLYIAMTHMFPGLSLPIPDAVSLHMHPLAFALAQLFLAIPVVAAGSRFYIVGLKTLLHGAPNMDSLVAIGTGSAFLYGVYATVRIALGDTAFAQSLYFESAAVVITLVMLGKMLEAVSKGRTSDAIR